MKRAAILLLILAAACGKEGLPRPPVPVIPRDISDLSAIQRGPRVVLSWSYPAFTTTGASLPSLEELVVYRFREVGSTPLDRVDRAGLDPKLPVELAVFERVPRLPPQEFRKVAEELASISQEELPRFARGARILFTDRLEIRGESGEPVRYTYGVVTVAGRSRSGMSNLVTVVPVDAPLPPAGLEATSTPPGIVLEWGNPSGTVLGEDPPEVLGYNVYRLPAEGRVSEPSRPINRVLIKEQTYSDQPSFGAHRYGVTAVMHEGEVPVESELPLLVSENYRDLLPPPPPAAVRALVEETSVRLVWDAVQAPDFEGYRVYRIVVGGRSTRLSEALVTDTFFVDETPELGVEYIYAVTSLDVRRNESERVETPPVILAR